MDKSDTQKNKKLLQLPNSNNYLNYNLPRLVATKTRNNEENNENNINYKNISLTMTGEISSDYIYRNNLTQKKPNITFIEDMEDDDEQFILNMKTIVDKNYKMQNKENFSTEKFQSKSYLSRKKKCAFSDEDQSLMKRFKKSVDESKASCIVLQKVQQPEHAASVRNYSCSTIYSPQIIPVVKYNDSDMNFRSNTNELFFHVASKTQKNDQWINQRTSENVETVTEREMEQLIYHMQYFTPPQKDDLIHKMTYKNI